MIVQPSQEFKALQGINFFGGKNIILQTNISLIINTLMFNFCFQF